MSNGFPFCVGNMPWIQINSPITAIESANSTAGQMMAAQKIRAVRTWLS